MMRDHIRWGLPALAIAVLVTMNSTPAAAQLGGDLHYAWGYTLVPDPPLATGPTVLQLYGNYPTGCGQILSATVVDAGHMSLRLGSTACVDSTSPRWVGRFDLGQLSAGMHTVAITLSMELPGSGTDVSSGWLTFEVVGGGSPPLPPGPPSPPAPPAPPSPPATPLLQWTATDPYPATPDRPMALILGGQAPFGCPVVTTATVLDTSRLAITLAPSTPCSVVDSTSSLWSHRLELGMQREGHHAMSVQIVLAGAMPDTVDTAIDFLVYHDGSGFEPPPEDSLAMLLSTGRPNPFVRESRFSISTDTAEQADVGVLDVQGRRVSRVFHGLLPAGTTELKWNGHRDDGTRAVPGVYFYRLEMRGRVVSRRLILLKQP